MKFGVIGSGSWGTALVKLLTDNDHHVSWTVRSEQMASQMLKKKHNPNYLHTVRLDTALLAINTDPLKTLDASDVVVIAVPSAYVATVLKDAGNADFAGKKIISAVKGILPEGNSLLNEYLLNVFALPPEHYFTIMGPCHAEEIAAEKLSYLTFSGIEERSTAELASCFEGPNLKTVINTDVNGVQYAGVLKNIYALGAGIAHGLDYGDNFLSVFIANAADEMACFLRKSGTTNLDLGIHSYMEHGKSPNYAASVYLGDLLVTCYSLFSRNRTFGNMIGKGYSVKAAQLELNMVAEGYNASKSIYLINQHIGAEMPIAENVYKILWEHLPPAEGMNAIEGCLI